MWSRGTRRIVGASLVLALAACGRPVSLEVGSGSTTGRGPLLIHGTGDVGLDPRQAPGLATHGPGWTWRGLDGLFVGDDLTVANLECPVTDIVAPVAAPVTFRCDPASLPAMRRAGVDVVSQANNHVSDQGTAGLRDSLSRIGRVGLAVVGAGEDREEALRAAIVRQEGWTIAVLGFDQVSDPDAVAGPRRPGSAPGRELGRVTAAIARAATEADLVIVAIHWGIEGSPAPTRLQVHQAHRMVDAGADVVFGSHAHRLHPLELYRGAAIFYGLGNTVWPRADGASGGIGRVLVRPDGSIEAAIEPVDLVRDGRPVVASGRPQAGGRGRAAGPFTTSPVGPKREPWHGQSKVDSPGFQSTVQPRWVQRADIR